MRARPLPALLLFALAVTAGAQPIYQTTDEDGTPVFTDQPSDDARSVELESPNVFDLPEAERSGRAVDGEDEGDGDGATYQVRITSPADEAPVRSNNGDVTITAAAEPQPARQDRYELILDGRAVARGQSGSFSLEALDRGEHTVRVRIVGPDGGIHGASEPVTFYLMRASRLNR
jgi:hypothetical protein